MVGITRYFELDADMVVMSCKFLPRKSKRQTEGGKTGRKLLIEARKRWHGSQPGWQ